MNIQNFRIQTKQRLKEIEQVLSQIDRIIMKHLQLSKPQLIIQSQRELTKEEIEKIEVDIKKLEKHIPIQYILQEQEFMKIPFLVDEHVLIPQPDTEILVEKIIETYKNKPVEILDLCTGSGAIAVSLAKYLPDASIAATDISKEALEIAKKNAEIQKVKVKFYEADIWNGVPDKKWDAIVSNPPYIETDIIKSLAPEVQKEPHIALDGGKDGLQFYRKIIQKAPFYLKENGKVFLEIGYNQKEAVEQIAKDTKSYKNIQHQKDLAGNDRVVELSI